MKVYFAGTTLEQRWEEYFVGRKNVLDLSNPESEQILQGGIPLVDDLTYYGPYVWADPSEEGELKEFCSSGSRESIQTTRQLIDDSDAIFAYLSYPKQFKILSYEIGCARALNRPIFLYLDEQLDNSELCDLSLTLSAATSIKEVSSIMEAFEDFRGKLKPNSSNSLTPFEELLSAEQTLQLIPLVEEASRYLNLLTHGYRGELEEVTEEEFEHLSAQEADHCIAYLTRFLTQMDVLKSARNESEVLQCLSDLPDIEKVRLRSGRFRAIMAQFQSSISRFNAYDFDEIWVLLRRGTRGRR